MAGIIVNVAVFKESDGGSAVTLDQNADGIKRNGALFHRHTRIPLGHDAGSAVRKDTVSYGGSRYSSRGLYPEAGSSAVLDRSVDQCHAGVISRQHLNTDTLTRNRTILNGDGLGGKDADAANSGVRGVDRDVPQHNVIGRQTVDDYAVDT